LYIDISDRELGYDPANRPENLEVEPEGGSRCRDQTGLTSCTAKWKKLSWRRGIRRLQEMMIHSCGCTQITGRRWSEIIGTADQQYTHETGQWPKLQRLP